LLSFVDGCARAAATHQPIGVVASDTFSKIAPPSEPLAPLAFGDAAAAAVIVPTEGERGLVSAVFDSDGSLGHLGAAPAPFPVTHARIDAGLYHLAGDPEELAKRSPALYADVTARALDAAGIERGAIDLFIPHQTSRPAIESAAKAAGLSLEETVMTAPQHGNCGTPGVLIALDQARRDGRFARDRVVLFAALGGGLGWGGAVFRA
jgi:3-oxoacyl-[acyl-carrier-protein] synthase-3